MLEGKHTQDLLKELEILRDKLHVAEETLEAIRTGRVDAVAIQGVNGTQIFTLQGADETYRVLVERMSESAITLNREGVILYCNSRFSNLVNLPLNLVIGSPFNKFLPEDLQDEFFSVFRKGLNEVVKGEFVIQPIGKPPMHVHLSLNSITTRDMVVLGMIITDLSDRKELEKLTEAKHSLGILNNQLTDKNRLLTRTNFDLDSFIYTASHDLKAPISNIEGLIAALETILHEEGVVKDEIDKIIAMMSGSVVRFKKTILDLTEITKTQKNFEEDISTINCKEIIEDVMDSIQGMIDRKNVKINIDTTHCAEINFSRKNLKSIVYNLISNAIKYSCPERQAEIFVKAENQNGWVLLTVKDNGLGINQQDQAKVFSMFKRLHDHVEGTGVGLYIVKRIIDNAGGKIELESEVGKGTVFKVYFRNKPF